MDAPVRRVPHKTQRAGKRNGRETYRCVVVNIPFTDRNRQGGRTEIESAGSHITRSALARETEEKHISV